MTMSQHDIPYIAVGKPHRRILTPHEHLERQIETGSSITAHQWCTRVGAAEDEQFCGIKCQASSLRVRRMIDATEESGPCGLCRSLDSGHRVAKRMRTASSHNTVAAQAQTVGVRSHLSVP